MTSDRIKEYYSARPFRAFTLHLADGSKARVISPAFMMIPPSGRTIIVVYTEDSGVEFVDLLLVTKVSVAGTNGVKRRRRPPQDR
jgi:hypothetical protein